MATFGGFSKFAFKLGGEPSNERKAYTSLKRVVGEGGSPPNDPDGETTFDGAWRRAKAVGLGALVSVVESSIYQAFPQTVTDELRSFEEIMGLYFTADTNDEDRRAAIVKRWVFENDSNFPAFIDELKSIDPRYSVVPPQHAGARYTFEGKSFGAPGNARFDQYRDHTKFPNFTDDHVIAVLFDIGEGVAPVGLNGQKLTAGENLLSEALPAWNDFSIACDSGITLDVSLLDASAFDE